MKIASVQQNNITTPSFKGSVHRNVIKFLDEIEDQSLYVISDNAWIEGKPISEEALSETKKLFSDIKSSFRTFAEQLHDKTKIKIGYLNKIPFFYLENEYTHKASLIPDNTMKLVNLQYFDITYAKLFRPYDIKKEGFKTAKERIISDLLFITDELKKTDPLDAERAMFKRKLINSEVLAQDGGNILKKMKIKSEGKKLNNVATFLNDTQDYKAKLLDIFEEANLENSPKQ